MWGLISSIFIYMWKEKSLRVYLINCVMVFVGCGIIYLYVNTKHAEAMGKILNVSTSQSNIDGKIDHLVERVDALYIKLIPNP